MKFQPARHTSAPKLNTDGMSAGSGLPTPVPNAPLAKSLPVNTSGDGTGGVDGASGAVQALPIVENDIGSQNTWQPIPCARMSVCKMPLMRNVESIDATPGTLEEPESRFTVSPRVVSASSGVSGRGIVHTTSSITGMLPKLHLRHFSAAPSAPGASPSPNGTRRTFSCESPNRARCLGTMLLLPTLAMFCLLVPAVSWADAGDQSESSKRSSGCWLRRAA